MRLLSAKKGRILDNFKYSEVAFATSLLYN